ncbi:probable protein phosphatase 2C 80 [Lycium ferocissimum]|uniref:probable protein phosphatase 2C 80 n=1 Tax=Lycium ferocissimum TaxID=112874 RepID=UPI0028159634|nr:probable protein phosphatase 2C 80 [Lycium ferocissimum]
MHFICIEQETIGVADGVGGWAKNGINSGEYSRQLVKNAELSIHKQKQQGNKIHPMKVLNEALFKYEISRFITDSMYFDFNLGNGYTCDDPSVAQEIKVPVKTWDVIVVGSDGLFDNVHDFELEKLVRKGLVDLRELGTFSKMLAQKIAEYALRSSQSKKNYTPFARECSKVGKHHVGGKPDDITVIVAHILPL